MKDVREARVRDYMATRLVTLDPQMDALAAMRRMIDAQVSGAPVVDAHGSLVGILTQRDCLEVAVQSSYYQEPAGRVAEFMSHPVTTVFADAGIVEVIEAFRSKPFRRFPVLEGTRLVGQISRRDILRAILEFWR